MEAGLDFYWESGMMVLTEHYLLCRGHCCDSGCRHCPYPQEYDVRFAVEDGKPVLFGDVQQPERPTAPAATLMYTLLAREAQRSLGEDAPRVLAAARSRGTARLVRPDGILLEVRLRPK
ncbi:hypothetical protein J4439_02160 [Candidatus Woesearchaeota archaeon]|nr:hypothetical protein [Candidatus Woesearchaeota archaeon]